MTLTQVSEQTGISYPTLVRYVRVHSDRLPSEGTGRSRRFHPEAVDVFRQLRQESGRGGRKPKAAKTAKVAGRRGPGRPPAAPAETGTGLAKRLRSIEKAQEGFEKKFRGFVQSLQKLFK
jgi:excisionase family DNA binding protein